MNKFQQFQQPTQPPAQGFAPPAQAPAQGFAPPAQAPAQGFAQPPAQGFAPPTQAPAQPPTQGFAPGASKYAGIQAGTQRDPLPNAGDYMFEVVSCEEGYNPSKGESFKAHLKVLASDGAEALSPGEPCTFVQSLAGKARLTGLGNMKRFIMACTGFDDEATYDQFDPNGEFMASCVGHVTSFTQHFPNGINGCRVRCRVTRGNPVLDKNTGAPTGDYYRNYAWYPVPADGVA